MKTEILADMSHELRTPLNAIIGFSEVLKDGLMGDLTDQQRGVVGDIFASGRRLLSLINDVLDLSRAEAGALTLDLETVEVSSLFVNSLSIVRERAANRRIRASLELAEGLGRIEVDPRKVKQIVYNLLSNAVRFAIDGSRVTLEASRVSRAAVGRLSKPWVRRSFPLAVSDFSEFLEISVTDGGVGISPDDLEQLFKPFARLDGELPPADGTGLGLTMVKLLTELHGGSVAVASAAGEGSCFKVWLPFRTPQEGTSSGPAALASEVPLPSTRLTALVVEDDVKSAELIRIQLEAEGFLVLHASSAEEALALAVGPPLSLITLDIVLPGMDGWQLLELLKQKPELRRVPVLIVSSPADRRRALSLGAAAVIHKPLGRQELCEALVDLGLLPASRVHPLKVLVVDDDSRAVALLADRLTDVASTVLRAYGGKDGIEMARKALPDLIVLDLLMPEVSGFDVIEALKETPETARIPILVVTAKQLDPEERARLSGYATTVMDKIAVDRDRFAFEVRRAMALRKAAI